MKKWRVKKLSTALRQSLDDLQRVRRMKSKYVIDMDRAYHEPMDDGKCSVCLAGCRLVGLGAVAHQYTDPYDAMDSQTTNMLKAMDSIRVGDVERAVLFSRGVNPYVVDYKPHPLDRTIVPYRTDPRKFVRQMRKLQRDLKKAGL